MSFIDQSMVSKIITYSTQGDGSIKIYPMPYQEGQSDEDYIEIAKQVIDDAYTIYVEPIDPYSVADFIGHVKFFYE